MSKRFDVVSTGECLIDVLLAEDRETNSVKMVGNAGGAPVNVLVALSHLNRATGYLGKISTDAFGNYLMRIIRDHGIDCSGVVRTDDKTALAMVSLSEDGDRDFSFYRQSTADVNYSVEDVNLDVIRDAHVFHFGSVSMTSEPSRSATLYAAQFAKENGVKVSFDPNLRPNLWENVADAKGWIEKGLALSDYVKVSEEELVYLTGTEDLMAGAKMLLDTYHFEFLSVTMGAKGATCFANGHCVYEHSFATNCIDTTGSGDASWGASLSCIAQHGYDLSKLTEEDLRQIARFANAGGALCAAKHGAIYAMAKPNEILDCICNTPPLL